jgi:hypothetical protein
MLTFLLIAFFAVFAGVAILVVATVWLMAMFAVVALRVGWALVVWVLRLSAR